MISQRYINGIIEVCWVRSPCLGLCERAPAVLAQRTGTPDYALAPATPTGALAAAVSVTDDVDIAAEI